MPGRSFDLRDFPRAFVASTSSRVRSERPPGCSGFSTIREHQKFFPAALLFIRKVVFPAHDRLGRTLEATTREGAGSNPQPKTSNAYGAGPSLTVVLDDLAALVPGLRLYYPSRKTLLPTLHAFVNYLLASSKNSTSE